jgi:hypothetical protein
VIGIEANEEFLLEARSRPIPNAEFRAEDLRTLPELGGVADGLWYNFTASYFPDRDRPKSWLDGYARDALAAVATMSTCAASWEITSSAARS